MTASTVTRLRPPIRLWAIFALTAALLAALLSAAPAQIAQAATVNPATVNHVYPADAVTNVVTDCGLVPDGKTDDTAALQHCVSAGLGSGIVKHVLYFPNGTYLVSGQIVWKNLKGTWDNLVTLQGQSRTGVTIRLADHTATFANPASPLAVFYTASRSSSSTGGGSGNAAQDNFFADLTVNTGANPGAIAIDYLANNRCAIRDVLLTGSGPVGLNMTRYATGPCVFEDVEVDGFATGIKIANLDYSVVFERLVLRGQTVAGMADADNTVTIRGLTTSMAGPVVVTSSIHRVATTLVTVLNANLGHGAGGCAINDTYGGALDLRNVTATGYATLTCGTGSSPPLTTTSYRYPPSSVVPLNLPVRETPVFSDFNPADVATTASFGCGNKLADNTPCFQKAIDSGAPVVSISVDPKGPEHMAGTLILRGTTRALVCNEAITEGTSTTAPMISVQSTGTAPVFIKNCELASNPNVYGIVDSGTAPLVIQDVRMPGLGYMNTKGAGPLYIDDVEGASWSFTGQQVWARQLDTEAASTHVTVTGGSLWALGLKTEKGYTVLDNEAGARTEILGGAFYPTGTVPAGTPMFRNSGGSHFTAGVAETAYSPGGAYPVIVAGDTTISPAGIPLRGYGTLDPLIGA